MTWKNKPNKLLPHSCFWSYLSQQQGSILEGFLVQDLFKHLPVKFLPEEPEPYHKRECLWKLSTVSISLPVWIYAWENFSEGKRADLLPPHTMHRRRKGQYLLFHPPYQDMGHPGFGNLPNSWLQNVQLKERCSGTEPSETWVYAVIVLCGDSIVCYQISYLLIIALRLALKTTYMSVLPTSMFAYHFCV